MNPYNFELNLQDNDTNAFIVNHIAESSHVLEFGAAYGRLTKYLSQEMQCSVDIVEIDEMAGKEAMKYASCSCVGEKEGDIETYIWKEQFSGILYDRIIFADVLEHLRDPKKVLEACKEFLKPDGAIIVSLPNIAHNAIIYNLLGDNFPYHETGLLDQTHIKFFTHRTFNEMIQTMGYTITRHEVVHHSVKETEFETSNLEGRRSLRKIFSQHPTGTIYQNLYILQADRGLIAKIDEENANDCIDDIYYAVCYIGDEEGTFNESRTVRKPIIPSKNQIVFRTDAFEQIEDVRIDPLNANCIISVSEITFYAKGEKTITEFITNGAEIGNGLYLFGTDDPQICFHIEKQHVDWIALTLQFLEYDCENMEQIFSILNEAFAQRRQLSAENHKLRDLNENLQQLVFLREREAGELRHSNENYMNEVIQTRNEDEMLRQNFAQEQHENELLRQDILQRRNENNLLKQECKNCHQMYDLKNQEMEQLYGSISWRMTKPLRWMKKQVKAIVKKSES